MVPENTIHPFTGFFVCRDNYLADPETVIEIARSADIEWRRSPTFQGQRSSNLLRSPNVSIQAFSANFGNRLSYDVFRGIKNFQIDICFHKYDVPHLDDQDVKTGWIHIDHPYCMMAGMVYLNPDELHMETGTSIFHGRNRYSEEEEKTLIPIVQEFNKSAKTNDEYRKIWKENKERFPETIRAANVFNRLIAYDAFSQHRTNSFSVSDGTERLTLLFYITEYEFGDKNE